MQQPMSQLDTPTPFGGTSMLALVKSSEHKNLRRFSNQIVMEALCFLTLHTQSQCPQIKFPCTIILKLYKAFLSPFYLHWHTVFFYDIRMCRDTVHELTWKSGMSGRILALEVHFGAVPLSVHSSNSCSAGYRLTNWSSMNQTLDIAKGKQNVDLQSHFHNIRKVRHILQFCNNWWGDFSRNNRY